MITIGLFSPSTNAELKYRKQFNYAIENMKKIGFNVIPYIQNKNYSGEERALIFNSMIENDLIDIIIFNLGGYLAIEMLPYIDYDSIRVSKKKIYGYSDCSILLNAITLKCGICTYLGPMTLTTFSEYPQPLEYTLKYFFESLNKSFGEVTEIIAPDYYITEIIDWGSLSWGTRSRKKNKSLVTNFSTINCEGVTCCGPLFGGNGESLVSILSTEYFTLPEGSILFLEDVSSDISVNQWIKILNTFKIHKIFDNISSLVIGAMPHYKTKTVIKILKSLYIEVPIVINFPSGHVDPHVTLPIGGEIEINENNIYIRW